MSQIAVIYYDKKNDTVCSSQISDDFQFEKYLGAMSKAQLADLCLTNKLKPVNFSIDRNGKVVEDCGSFSRFGSYGECGVILAEIHNTKNETEGYRVLQCTPNGVIVNLTTETIVKKNKEVNGSFIQNGIIRENGDKTATIACYPQKPFQIMNMRGEKKVKKVVKTVAKDVLDAVYNITIKDSTLTITGKTDKKSGTLVADAPIKTTRDVGLMFATHLSSKTNTKAFLDDTNTFAMDSSIRVIVRHTDGKCMVDIDGNVKSVTTATEIGLFVKDYLTEHYGKVKEEVAVNKEITNKDKYSKEQIREILACRKKGINSKFIENPKLQPSQMRILWLAKSKGIFMNQVAKPSFSEDALKAYADILYNKAQVTLCKPIIAHPEFDGEKVRALYEALQHGLKVEPLVNLSVDEIYDKIQAKKADFWDKPFTQMTQEEFEKVQGDITESLLKTVEICKDKYVNRKHSAR